METFFRLRLYFLIWKLASFLHLPSKMCSNWTDRHWPSASFNWKRLWSNYFSDHHVSLLLIYLPAERQWKCACAVDGCNFQGLCQNYISRCSCFSLRSYIFLFSLFRHWHTIDHGLSSFSWACLPRVMDTLHMHRSVKTCYILYWCYILLHQNHGKTFFFLGCGPSKKSSSGNF